MNIHKCIRCGKEMRTPQKICDKCFVEDNIDRFGYL